MPTTLEKDRKCAEYLHRAMLKLSDEAARVARLKESAPASALEECREREQVLYKEIEYAKYDLNPDNVLQLDETGKAAAALRLEGYAAELKTLRWKMFEMKMGLSA